MIGFEISQVIIKFFKTENSNSFQQLGLNGPNVLDHVNHFDEECVLSNTAVMDWNLKKKTAIILQIQNCPVFNQLPIF